jgi:hypothetical protein
VAFWGRCPKCRKQGRVATRLDPQPDRRRRTNIVTTPKGKTVRPS